MKVPRGLSPEDAALWARVASSVTPFKDRLRMAARLSKLPVEPIIPPAPPVPVKKVKGRVPPPKPVRPTPAPPPKTVHDPALDSSWERKLTRAQIEPDFTLDLHGHTLDQAYVRLDMGLSQAKAMGARLVLLITGKSRNAEAADRGTKRGAIRAKTVDWLAAGQHASDIVAIRNAHRRHGGEGALYLVMKRRR